MLVDPVSALDVAARWLGDTGVRRGAWPPTSRRPSAGCTRSARRSWLPSCSSPRSPLPAWRCGAPPAFERLRELHKQRGARWAKDRELKRLHVKGAAPGRVTLGRRGSQLLASEANASTLIVAPSQAGKTSGLAVPAMVEWDGPILATSVKGDLLVDTLKARRMRGEVKVFDPTDSTTVAGRPGRRSPPRRLERGAAPCRVDPADRDAPARRQDDSFWRQAGASHLAPLLLAGNFLEVSTSVVLKWATSTDEEALSEPWAP